MSTITYLIAADYDNYDIGCGGGYVHGQVYHEEVYAITEAQRVIEKYDLQDGCVLKINTSNGTVSSVWEQGS